MGANRPVSPRLTPTLIGASAMPGTGQNAARIISTRANRFHLPGAALAGQGHINPIGRIDLMVRRPS